ncbi:hypothetical protein [Demequina sediminicola]|uniref:hypothetical protein n=1 Tax=Demequina sediminicola TaxID=1095026 RepID=UPI000A49ABAF|nr:hypothetical protein [Demequina sediminicola]
MMFEALSRLQIPDGCADCNAVQMVTAGADDITVITVYHDEYCPAYQARGGGRRE